MDLVMETPNIMQVHEDCLVVLFNPALFTPLAWALPYGLFKTAFFLQEEEETLLDANLMQVDIIEPHPKSHPRLIPDPLEGCLQEAPIFMFPPFNPKEQPYGVQVLLDSIKYLHIHFSGNVYQFEDPHREDVLRNIRLGIAPPRAQSPQALCAL
ncbi:hypothetical protein J3A83DRAFT_4381344 [Scleroderma citrinum]